ncbi:MAG: hypothetical protein KDD43_13095 [Bdellovibrionales bacterium]|nr:hypothetical protein [Bdellovibrionales bacterium]
MLNIVKSSNWFNRPKYVPSEVSGEYWAVYDTETGEVIHRDNQAGCNKFIEQENRK